MILPDGTISEGWIGGGRCACCRFLEAAKDALADGRSRLVSVQSPDLRRKQGVEAGDVARGHPLRQEYVSQPRHDAVIFIEPVLPPPAG